MKVAVVQTDPQFGEKRKNIDQALHVMRSVSADVYVLPELFASGYNFLSIEETRSLAEPFRHGETYNNIKQFAVDRRCYVVYGFAEIDDDALYNSAGMIGFDGKEEVYRKIHLFDREKLFFQPGNLGFNVYDTPYGKIGIMICFDWYFPESARTLAAKGAQLIAHPSNLVLPNCPNSMPTRCLENRVFAATANRIGTEDRGGIRLSYIGQSQITSVKGEILHRASSDRLEVFVDEIDLTRADNKNVNERNNLFKDRRPEYYV
ncbi:MAG: nitrilase-related carbon-nitrogen hydrolase [Bacteroidota bacterium]|nr:nitrilase-related carbon-nitrogen hydrolase [Bacteroidota bacterium]